MSDGKTKPTGDNTPMPLGLMSAILLVCPKGLPARLLFDILVEQGVDSDVASHTIRACLDAGTIALGPNMNIVRAE